MYGMTGIAMTGGSLVSLFLPMGYEGATRGSTIASKTAALLTVVLAASAYYASFDSRLFGAVSVIWMCSWTFAWIVYVALDLTFIPPSSMKLSVLVQMLGIGLGVAHSAGVLLTGFMVGGQSTC
jgi:hypothetical protein